MGGRGDRGGVVEGSEEWGRRGGVEAVWSKKWDQQGGGMPGSCRGAVSGAEQAERSLRLSEWKAKIVVARGAPAQRGEK